LQLSKLAIHCYELIGSVKNAVRVRCFAVDTTRICVTLEQNMDSQAKRIELNRPMLGPAKGGMYPMLFGRSLEQVEGDGARSPSKQNFFKRLFSRNNNPPSAVNVMSSNLNYDDIDEDVDFKYQDIDNLDEIPIESKSFQLNKAKDNLNEIPTISESKSFQINKAKCCNFRRFSCCKRTSDVEYLEMDQLPISHNQDQNSGVELATAPPMSLLKEEEKDISDCDTASTTPMQSLSPAHESRLSNKCCFICIDGFSCFDFCRLFNCCCCWPSLLASASQVIDSDFCDTCLYFVFLPFIGLFWLITFGFCCGRYRCADFLHCTFNQPEEYDIPIDHVVLDASVLQNKSNVAKALAINNELKTITDIHDTILDHIHYRFILIQLLLKYDLRNTIVVPDDHNQICNIGTGLAIHQWNNKKLSDNIVNTIRNHIDNLNVHKIMYGQLTNAVVNFQYQLWGANAYNCSLSTGVDIVGGGQAAAIGKHNYFEIGIVSTPLRWTNNLITTTHDDNLRKLRHCIDNTEQKIEWEVVHQEYIQLCNVDRSQILKEQGVPSLILRSEQGTGVDSEGHIIKPVFVDSEKLPIMANMTGLLHPDSYDMPIPLPFQVKPDLPDFRSFNFISGMIGIHDRKYIQEVFNIVVNTWFGLELVLESPQPGDCVLFLRKEKVVIGTENYYVQGNGWFNSFYEADYNNLHFYTAPIFYTDNWVVSYVTDIVDPIYVRLQAEWWMNTLIIIWKISCIIELNLFVIFLIVNIILSFYSFVTAQSIFFVLWQNGAFWFTTFLLCFIGVLLLAFWFLQDTIITHISEYRGDCAVVLMPNFNIMQLSLYDKLKNWRIVRLPINFSQSSIAKFAGINKNDSLKNKILNVVGRTIETCHDNPRYMATVVKPLMRLTYDSYYELILWNNYIYYADDTKPDFKNSIIGQGIDGICTGNLTEEQIVKMLRSGAQIQRVYDMYCERCTPVAFYNEVQLRIDVITLSGRHLGQFPNPCDHTAVRSFVLRQGRDVPPASRSEIDNLVAFANYWLPTILPVSYIRLISLIEWYRMKRPLQKQRYDRVINPFDMLLTKHELKTEAFNKFEMSFKPYEGFILGIEDDVRNNWTNRFITGAQPEYSYNLGMYIHTANEVMASVLCYHDKPTSHGEYIKNFVGESIYYVCGENNEDIGAYYEYVTDRFGAAPIIIPADYVKYDIHQHAGLLQLEQMVLAWLFPGCIDVILLLISQLYTKGIIRCKCGKDRCGLRYINTGGKGSGMMNTCFGGSIINILCQLYVLNKQFNVFAAMFLKMFCMCLLCDDTLLFLNGFKIDMQKYQADMLLLGLEVEAKLADLYSVKFCSAVFLPCSIVMTGGHIRNTHVLTRFPGKRLAKSMISQLKFTAKQRKFWVALNCYNYVREFAAIPWLASYWRKLGLKNTHLGKTPKFIKYMVRQEFKFSSTGSKYLPNSETLKFLNYRYGFDENNLKRLQADICNDNFDTHETNMLYQVDLFDIPHYIPDFTVPTAADLHIATQDGGDMPTDEAYPIYVLMRNDLRLTQIFRHEVHNMCDFLPVYNHFDWNQDRVLDELGVVYTKYTYPTNPDIDFQVPYLKRDYISDNVTEYYPTKQEMDDAIKIKRNDPLDHIKDQFRLPPREPPKPPSFSSDDQDDDDDAKATYDLTTLTHGNTFKPKYKSSDGKDESKSVDFKIHGKHKEIIIKKQNKPIHAHKPIQGPQRKSRLNRNKKCVACGQLGHLVIHCDQRLVCKYCDGKHQHNACPVYCIFCKELNHNVKNCPQIKNNAARQVERERKQHQENAPIHQNQGNFYRKKFRPNQSNLSHRLSNKISTYDAIYQENVSLDGSPPMHPSDYGYGEDNDLDDDDDHKPILSSTIIAQPFNKQGDDKQHHSDEPKN
jgi:hypothetical protein